MAAKRKKAAGERLPRLRTAARWLADHLRTGAMAIGIRGGLLIGLAAACLIGTQVAKGRVGSMRHFRVYPSRFRAKAPEWCAADLATVAFPRDSYSIFDPALTREVAEAYLKSPWVASVARVEKRFPNELRVQLELRRPVAFVRLPQDCYAIDSEAVSLPLDYRRWDHAAEALPLVYGVDSDPPRPGTRWADRRVRAAVSVLEALATDPAVLKQVHIINVANLDGDIDPLRSEVLLYTRRRVAVDWGRPPDTRKFGEPPAHEKVAHLRRELDGGPGPTARIDCRFLSGEAVARP